MEHDAAGEQRADRRDRGGRKLAHDAEQPADRCGDEEHGPAVPVEVVPVSLVHAPVSDQSAQGHGGRRSPSEK